MDRQSSRPARGTLTGLAAAVIALATTCNPSNNVKPGAPVLTEVLIIENGSSGTVIPAGTVDCPAATTDGGDCDLTIPICRFTSASNWCRCVQNTPPAPPAPPPNCSDGGAADGGADASDDAGAGSSTSDDASSDVPALPPGSWNCAAFAPNSQVLFVFDRVLYTPPLDPDNVPDGGTLNVAKSTIAPTPTSTVTTSTDYASNGSPKEVIFPLFGDLRTDGPSVLVSAQPELPGGSTITIGLDTTKVRSEEH